MKQIQVLLYAVALHLLWAMLGFLSLFNKKARKLFLGSISATHQLANWRKANPKSPVVWFHVASLGEFEQAKPVIEAIRAARPELKIILTFFSPSGYEHRKSTPVADLVTYLPPDLFWLTSKYHQTMKAEMAFFVKYDFWYHHVIAAKKSGAILYCLSASFHSRQVYFKPWAAVFREMLRQFDEFFLQNQTSAQLLNGIGIQRHQLTGDTRFDRVAILPDIAPPLQDLAKWCEGHKTLVVGSSWPQDIDALIEVLHDKSLFARIIIAPHDVSQGSIKQMVNQIGEGHCLYSRFEFETRICIIDSIGKLNSAYRYADVAYVGGAFKQGLHNILEPAAFSKPVVFGPLIHKFPEASELIQSGGGISVSNPRECYQAVQVLLKDQKAGEKAGNFIKERKGATEKVMQWLKL